MFIWIQLNNSPNLISWRQSKIQKNILKIFNKILPHRIGNDWCSENTFLWQPSFLFSSWRLFSFLKFMKMWSKLTKAILNEAWPWHSRSNICHNTGKSGSILYKLIMWAIKQTAYKFSKIFKIWEVLNSRKGWLTLSAGKISSLMNN